MSREQGPGHHPRRDCGGDCGRSRRRPRRGKWPVCACEGALPILAIECHRVGLPIGSSPSRAQGHSPSSPREPSRQASNLYLSLNLLLSVPLNLTLNLSLTLTLAMGAHHRTRPPRYWPLAAQLLLTQLWTRPIQQTTYSSTTESVPAHRLDLRLDPHLEPRLDLRLDPPNPRGRWACSRPPALATGAAHVHAHNAQASHSRDLPD